MKVRAVSASTKHSNTKESDLLPEVLHVVKLSNGETLEVMASDPMDAIDKANKKLEK
jgi:predicted Zn-dependent protease